MDRGIQVTFDATGAHELARWWAKLVSYEIEDCHDFVTRLLAEDVIGESDVVRIEDRLFFADAVAARDPSGRGPRMLFQQVPEPKSAKNRVHLDIPVDPETLDAEVERLRAEGASLIEYGAQGDHRFAVMRDPEGNEFCLQ